MAETAAELINRAATARREGRQDAAYQLFNDAVTAARATGNTSDLVGALKELGQMERGRGHNDDAIARYDEAVTLCRSHTDVLALAHTVRHLGDIYQEARRLQEAAACYQEALALYRSHGEPPPLDLANALRASAVLQERTGERDMAAQLWQEARDLYATVNVEAGVAESERRLARLRA